MNGAETVYELLDYTNLGAYQFPRVIAWRTSTYPETFPTTLLATGTVTMVSVRVPEQIPDSTFELDEKSVVTVWDWDQRKLTKVGPRSVTYSAHRGAAMYILLSMILMTVLLVWISNSKRFASRHS
jgi:hypothetical protein